MIKFIKSLIITMIITATVTAQTLSIISDEKHNMSNTWIETQAPTCETDGKETRYCEDEACTYFEERSINAFGHNWKLFMLFDGANATCTSGITRSKYCLYDKKHVAKVEIPPLGHYWNEWTTIISATEEEYGEEMRFCLRVNWDKGNCYFSETRKTDKLAQQ